MVNKHKKYIRAFSLLIVLSLGLMITVASAWATVSLIKPDDATHNFEHLSRFDIPTVVESDSKAWAPEPSTIALFGGGFFGMVLSFVRIAYSAMKRLSDVIAATIGLILLSPIILLTIILVKLTSKGPVFYSQERVGKNGETFNIYKFRTMKVDAEKESGPVWASKDDQRITSIGKFLRQSRIDELPQFINILKGEMSLIGPRPERPLFVNQFKNQISDYEKRLQVKPGITGLAQVWHRYDETIEDVKKKVKYDVLYIKKMCFWADFQIILRTFQVVITGFGAR